MLTALALLSTGYFIFMRFYLSDPLKQQKDADWRKIWEPQNLKRQIENERRRPSLDGMFQRESLKIM